MIIQTVILLSCMWCLQCDEHARRLRRNVFGKDTRANIPLEFSEDFPFSAIVKVEDSSRRVLCTGTLIWTRHVLTAAHCIHDRTRFIAPPNSLTVGFLKKDGTYTIINVNRVLVPDSYTKWPRSSSMHYLEHNYAVLELSYSPQDRKPMPMESVQLRDDQYIQFAGFPVDKQGETPIWFSFCKLSYGGKFVHKILNYCDASRGMQGAGVYVTNYQGGRNLIGVFGKNVETTKGQRRRGTKSSINFISKLTRKKIEEICLWMGAGRFCMGLRGYKSRSV